MPNLQKHKYKSAFLLVIIAACGSLLWLRGDQQENLPRPPLLCRSRGEPGGVFVTWQAPDRITCLNFPKAPGQQFAINPDAFCFWRDKLVWWANGASLKTADDQGSGLIGLMGVAGPVRWIAPTPSLSPKAVVLGLSTLPSTAHRPDVVRLFCDTIGDQHDFVLELALSTGKWRKVGDVEIKREREQEGYLEPLGGTRLLVHPPQGGPTRLITDCRQPELAVYDAVRNAVAYNNTYSTPFHEGQIAYNSREHLWTRPGPGPFDHFALTIRPESGEIWTADRLQSAGNNGLAIYAPDGRRLGWRTRLRFPVGPYIELTPMQAAIVRRFRQTTP